jgi:hypothetical protein
LRHAACAAAAAALSGCPSVPALFQQKTVETSQEAANVYVSAYPVVPWSEISDKLEPKHALTTEQARTLAAVTTQAQVSQFLSTFSAGLGIGLPARSDSATRSSTTDASGTTEQASTSSSRGTGTVPSSSGQAPSAITDAALAADLSRLPPTLAVDASTLLTAGTGVYQLAQILDHQISKAFYPAGYQAHLLTFQIALQPKARNLPYDAYVDLALYPADWAVALRASSEVNEKAGGLPPVVVYPLVISDAMESASTARSIEVIRQAALQLSGVVGRFGVSAGAGGGSDALDAVIGQTRNSIVAVGRVSNHALRIRLGAQNSGSAGVAMVPRTHNISVVVLTRWALQDPSRQVTGLSVTSRTEIVPADGGPPLPTTRERERLAEAAKQKVGQYQFAVLPGCAAARTADPGEPYLDLLRAVDRQDYRHVAGRCLALLDEKGKPGAAVGELPGVGDRIRLERLLSALEQIQVDTRYAAMVLPLKPRVTPRLPDESQLATLVENDETGLMTFTLRGGRGLRRQNLDGRLLLAEPKDKALLPTSISVVDNGAEVSLTFPAPGQFAPAARMEDAGALVLDYAPEDEPALRARYSGRRLAERKKKEEKAGARNPVSVSQTLLVPDEKGAARLTLSIGELAKNLSGPMRLIVKGADVREDDRPGSARLMAEGVAVAENSIARIVLGNLSPAQPVTITTVVGDRSDAKKDAAIGEPITLRIAR